MTDGTSSNDRIGNDNSSIGIGSNSVGDNGGNSSDVDTVANSNHCANGDGGPCDAEPRTSDIKTVLAYLTNVPAWYLATSVDDQPHVRPFSFASLQDGKIWFCTATTKDVWEELQANRRFEATAWWPGHGWLILRGRAGLVDRAGAAMRQAGYDHLTMLGERYDGPNDPRLVFFSVEEPQAWICDHEEWNPLAL